MNVRYSHKGTLGPWKKEQPYLLGFQLWFYYKIKPSNPTYCELIAVMYPVFYLDFVFGFHVLHIFLGPILLTWINFNPSMDK